MMSVFKSQLAFELLDNGLARRQGLMSDGSTAWEVKLTAGTFDQLQKRPYPQQIRILSGIFEFTVGSDVHTLIAEETLLIPAATVFGCFCLDDGILLEIQYNA